jgi:SAM-dependent methyltransferase
MNNAITLLSIEIHDQYSDIWENLLGLDVNEARKLDIGNGLLTVKMSTTASSFVLDFSYVPDSNEQLIPQKLARLASRSFYTVFRNFFTDNNAVNLFELSVLFEATFPLLKALSKDTIPYVEQYLSRTGYDFTITDNEQMEGFKVLDIQRRAGIKYLVTDLYTFLLFAAMRITPHDIRHEMILGELNIWDSEKVIDLGCGDGAFIFHMLDDIFTDEGIKKISGVEIDPEPFSKATERLKGLAAVEGVELMQADITTCDQRFKEFDTVLLIEVIEHLEDTPLKALEKVVFDFIRPRHVLVSTPNADYNKYVPEMLPNGFRHWDHKFEWGKDEFMNWSQHIESGYGYSTDYIMIGRVMENNSSMSQMMLFKRIDQ